MMKILENQLECVGCGSCASACPKNCISMKPLEGGFLYPEIDHNICISCGKCKSVCPVLAAKQRISPVRCYALLDKREESRTKSASGGASYVFAEQIIKDGGVFCGVKLDKNLKAVHDITDTFADLDLYRDSKYVQSDMSLAWQKIESTLKQDKKILVSGTPCQIAAVKRRFGDTKNLITCDIICSGVPDPKIFELYLYELGKNQGSPVKEFYFRDKTNGWKKSNIRVVFENGTTKIIERKDSYYFGLFGNNIYFRKSCFNCAFKNFNTCADLTIGDYWGIEKKYPELDDNKGCSVVIINTTKGNQFFKEATQNCEIVETPLNFAIDTHPKLITSIHESRYRSLFYQKLKQYNEKYLHKALKICIGKSGFNKIQRKIYLIANKKGEKTK